MKMKLLIYKWNAFLESDIFEICQDEGLEYESFSWKFVNKNMDDNFEIWFHQTVDKDSFTALISINFWPMLSKVCQSKGLKYIAWCYDNPLNVVQVEETLANTVNYVPESVKLIVFICQSTIRLAKSRKCTLIMLNKPVLM